MSLNVSNKIFGSIEFGRIATIANKEKKTELKRYNEAKSTRKSSHHGARQ